MLNIIRKSNAHESLCKHLLKDLAPVLCALKPTFLTCFSQRSLVDDTNYLEVWKACAVELTAMIPLEYVILNESDCGVQVLFYDKVQLAAVLADESIRAFIDSYGYSDCRTVLEFLSVLRARYLNPGFPHEIGVFLGYPLKDVLGFVEKGPQAAVACGRWKVYGETCHSLTLMQNYELAEELFKLYMKNNINPLERIDYLKMFVN